MGNAQTTGASAYKKKIIAKVDVPSGAKVRIRTPGLDSFLRRGFIPDTLSPIIRQASKGKKNDVENNLDDLFDDIGRDDSKLNELFGLLDNIVMDTWVEPEVQPLPEDGEERSDDLLYIDEVVFDDKMFTFNFAVGGTKDLESFRSESTAMLDRVSSSEAVEQQTE